MNKLFSEFADEYMYLPNVCVITKELDDKSYPLIVGHFLSKEKHTNIHHFPEACMRSADTREDKEVVSLRLTYFDDGDFADVKPELLSYEGEKEYYKRIETQLREKILDNQNSDQDKTSRRIIYHDDSCISLAHFLIREQMFDAKFFVRSLQPSSL